MSGTSFGGDGPPHTRGAELAAVGPVIDIRIRGTGAQTEAVEARGLIDTGASAVFVDRRIALQLGLKAIDSANVQVPGGLTIPSTVYVGYLEIPLLGYRQLTRFYGAAHRQASHDVLLGRSFLRDFIVTFDGPAGIFHFYRPFTFVGPSSDEDYAT